MLAASALSSSATAQETRKFDVDLRAAVAHDSNVSRSSPQLAALRGLSLADTTYSPTLALDVLLPVGRESVFLKGSAGYVTHDRNSRLDAERFDFTGGVNARLNICSTKLTADYFRGRSELGDITVVNVVKNVLELKKASLDVHCARESGLGLTGSASYDWANNSTTQLKSTDYNTTSFSGGIYYTRPALGTITVFGNHSRTEYPSHLLQITASPGYELTSGGVTFDRRLGARIEGTVTAAYSKVDPISAVLLGQPSIKFSGVTYSAELTFRPTSRLTTHGSFDRTVKPSNKIGNAYDLETVYRVSGDYTLGQRIVLSLAGEQRDSDSHGVSPLIALPLTNSTTKIITGSIRYRQSRRLSLSLEGGDERRETNNPLFNYTDNRIALSADFRY
jgi:hypothetical protein